MHYYGDMSGGGAVPGPQVSSAIPPGGQLTFWLSKGNAAAGIAGAAGFRGYAIADCGGRAEGAAAVSETTAGTPIVSSVGNSAANTPPLAPGSLATIYGGNLGSSSSPPTVTIGGQQAYVLYVNTGQLNVQVPVNAPLGQVNVTVTVGSLTSAPFAITLAQYAPAIFTVNGFGTGLASCTRSNGSVISASNAPNPLEVVSCYGTGFGPTNPVVPTGTVPTGLAPTVAQPTVTVGVATAQVTFSGLVSIGEYQINFRIPGSVAASASQKCDLSIGGKSAIW